MSQGIDRAPEAVAVARTPGSGAPLAGPPGAPVPRPLAGQPHDRLVWMLAAAMFARAVLGIADSISLAQGGVRTIPVVGAVALGAPSPLWSALLAVLAMVGAVGLAGRWTMAWIVSIAVCLGYVASGIGDLAQLEPSSPVASPSFLILFLANLLVPAIVIGGLLQVRSWYMRVSARPLATRLRHRTPGRGGSSGTE